MILLFLLFRLQEVFSPNTSDNFFEISHITPIIINHVGGYISTSTHFLESPIDFPNDHRTDSRLLHPRLI